MTTSAQHQQRSNNWNDMPYAALQLIADYHCVKASDALLVVGCVCKRWHDAATNYLPGDVWRRFYHRLVFVHYRIPEKQIAEAKLPTPDTLQAYSNAARHWYSFTADARALREVFRGVENMPRSWNVHALGTVGAWTGVQFEGGRVTEVALIYESLDGSVNFTKLPAEMQRIWLQGNQLSGSADLTQLPAGLRILGLQNNRFTGAVDLTRLPASLMHLSVNHNQFSGSIDLTQLPASLVHLYLNDNPFSGSVDLTQLPVGLQSLSLNDNKLSGSVDLTQLPASLVHLDLNDNQFAGLIDLTQLPENLQRLHLTNNRFERSTSVNNKECNVKVDDTVEIKK